MTFKRLTGREGSSSASGRPHTTRTIPLNTTSSPTSRSVFVIATADSTPRYFSVNLISTATSTATGFPSLSPGLNRHCFIALTAWSSRP
jgi:hypothetical protein